ncbi:MAG TPA: class I SAM-dependent methyltransferase [Patescibacteria group bacterium]|nr:class I SAM-dependent methyltransferase [Patescibacteria group bacterium]
MAAQQELLNRKVNEALYHFEAREYDRRHPETMAGDSQWWEGFARQHLKGRRTILDIGTGTGLVPFCLRGYLEPGQALVCYDISQNMLLEARQKLKGDSRFSFIRGDAGALPFPTESFDAVVFNSLLHHIVDYEGFLRECGRVLKPAGVLAFAHEPNRAFLKSRFCRMLANVYNLFFPIQLTAGLQGHVNAQLKEEGLITQDLSREEIRRMVEFHSPMEQSRVWVDSSKGFDPQELVERVFYGWRVLELSEYSTYFHRPIFEKSKLASSVMRCARRFALKRGNLFRMVLQK